MLPPPEEWSTFPCQRCDKGMRVPFPPSDGLCSNCRDKEQVTVAKTVEERLAEAGAPSKYAQLTRASWEKRFGPWAEHAQLRRLVGWPHHREGDSWLAFITSGGYGDRKTGLGTAVLGEALEHALRGRWEAQSDWLRDIKASWKGGRDVDPEHVVWRRAADAPVLLFDDFGGVEGTQPSDRTWWRVQVTHLLHYRECRSLPTIVTANLTDWRQVRRVHESLVSRMDVPLKIALPSVGDFRVAGRQRRGL